MTTLNKFPIRNRDQQDGAERHIFSEIEHVDGYGHIIKVKGTGTQDEELVHMSVGGLGFSFPQDTELEVHALAGGSDTCQKYCITVTKHDKERRWKEGTNGLQNMLDGDKALEFNKKRTWLTEGNFAVGAGLFEIKDGKVYFRVPVHIPELYANGVGAPDVPAWDE